MIFDEICEIVGGQLEVDPEDISEEMNLFEDLDVNDTAMLRILSEIEEKYDLDEFPEEKYEDFSDLEVLCQYVREQTGEE